MLKSKTTAIISALLMASIATGVFAEEEADPATYFNEARFKELNPDCGVGCSSYPAVKATDVKAESVVVVAKPKPALIKSEPTVVTPRAVAPFVWSGTNLAFKEGWYVGFGLSQAKYQNTDTAVVNVQPGVPSDTYFPASISNTTLYEISAGYQFAGMGSMSFPAYRLGLLYQTGGSEQASGNMWQISFPPNQVYSGTIKTQSLFLQAQLDLLNYWGFAPYLEGGIGMAKHELSGYSVANPNYIMTIPNGTHTNFAWLFGIGVGYHFTAYAHEMIVSLGARYVDKGVAQSGIVYAQSNPNQGGVLQQSIRDTELGLNLRYIF